MSKKFYLVGGAVRDHFLGKGTIPHDKDYVITGSSVEELNQEKWLRQIGKDFPIWVDHHGTEFALARSSRDEKINFSPDTTIEQDLLKRDLTINSIAVEQHPHEYGKPFFVIDPYNGKDDIKNKILRMTSVDSFRDDPIRILRVARFYARLEDFTIDPVTFTEMKSMVREGKLNDAQPERVWKELSRGLLEKNPARMIRCLHDCGALQVILPEVDNLYGVPQRHEFHPEVDTGLHVEQALTVAARRNYNLEIRFAVLLHDVGKGITPLAELPSHVGHEEAGVPLVESACRRLMVPNILEKIAVATAREHLNIHRAMDVKTTTVVKLLRRCDAFRNPARFQWVLAASECDARGRWNTEVSHEKDPYPQRDRLTDAVYAAKEVRGHRIAEQYKDRPEFIPVALHAERARAIRHFERKKKERETHGR